MNSHIERIYNGVVKENPTIILMLGMCPTLAVTTSAFNGFGMGASTTVVLIASNFIISLLRKVIPEKIRIPAYIVIVATLVTVVQLMMQAYVRSLYDALGIYIPLIVVNCIILGRAESYASKHTPSLSIMDGLGMGLGFTLALSAIGFCRELIGAGTILSGTGLAYTIPVYEPIGIFVLAPGAFITLAFIIALLNALQIKNNGNKKVESCDGNCCNCKGSTTCENKIEG